MEVQVEEVKAPDKAETEEVTETVPLKKDETGVERRLSQASDNASKSQETNGIYNTDNEEVFCLKKKYRVAINFVHFRWSKM